MTQNVDRKRATPSVAPLRMQKPDGTPYERLKQVEQELAGLLQMPSSELVRRARIAEPEEPDYVRSECVLYFVRRPAFVDDETTLHDLFGVLRQRVFHAVPVPAPRLVATNKRAERGIDLEVRDVVLLKFQELLCGDRREYDKRLDFYECRFNQAVAFLRATARRDVRREESHYQPLSDDGDLNESSIDAESAFAAILEAIEGENEDSRCRSKLHVAISSLPAKERQVIELMLKGLPVHSADEDAVTIAKVMGCYEKTVRNRRDRAIAKLRDSLTEEDDA